MSKQNGFDPKRVTQTQLASITGKRPSWIRENSHVIPRNADGTYDAPAVLKLLASQLAPAELDPDDVERALQSLDFLARTDRDEFAIEALLNFLDSVERQYGPPGFLAVLQLWRSDMTSFVEKMRPFRSPETEETIRASYAQRCEAAIESLRKAARGEYLLQEITRCEKCRRYRWGNNWSDENPRPDLDVRADICWECFGK